MSLNGISVDFNSFFYNSLCVMGMWIMDLELVRVRIAVVTRWFRDALSRQFLFL